MAYTWHQGNRENRILIYGSNCYYDIACYYTNVSRSGTSVSGRFAIALRNSDSPSSWTSNGIAAQYGSSKQHATSYFPQPDPNGNGPAAVLGHGDKRRDWTYCGGDHSGYSSSSKRFMNFNQSDSMGWDFSATISGDGSGTVDIEISFGCDNTTEGAGGYSDLSHSFTAKIPYPAEIKTSLQIREENVDGTWGNYYEWKKVTGSYENQTWTKEGYQDVTFGSSSPGSSGTVQKDAYRKKYHFDINGRLDGTDCGGLIKDNIVYGRCTITSNDGLVQDGENCTDYYREHRHGATITVQNISQSIGRTYKGTWEDGKVVARKIEDSMSIILEGEYAIRLVYNTNAIRVRSGNEWKPGDTYIMVNGVWKRAPGLHIKQNDWKLLDG